MLMKNRVSQAGRFLISAALLAGMIGQQPSGMVHAAAYWYVATTGSDSNSCATVSDPCLTINMAVTRATAGDVIKVANGMYAGGYPTVVNVTKSLTILGGWNESFSAQTAHSIIDGSDKAHHGLTVNVPDVTISKFIIRNSKYGINLSAGSFNFERGAIINSEWGIYEYGIYSSAAITNTTLSGNAGAISVYGGKVVIRYSTITNNGGYAINSLHSDAYIEIGDSILAGNLNNQDCRISSVSHFTSLGHNIFGPWPVCYFSSGPAFVPDPTDMVGVDPQLLPLLPVGHHPLLPDSPAVESGNPSTCPADDVRGVARPQGAACDIGSYEYTTPGTAASFGYSAGSSQRAGPLLPFPKPLVLYVIDSVGSPVGGVEVTFTAPASGASGSFTSSGTRVTTVESGNDGLAVTSAFTANSQLGAYAVSGTVSGLSGSVEFSLTNANWFVSTEGNDGNPCSSPVSPCKTITAAITRAVGGDLIKVASGVYLETTNVDKSLILTGGWDDSFNTQNRFSIIDGGNGIRNGISSGGPNVSISRFIVRNSRYGIWHAGGVFNFTQGAVIDNQVGVYNDYGDATFENTTFSGNQSDGYEAGAVENNGGTVRITSSTIAHNSGYYAIHSVHADALIKIGNSILAGNGAGDCYIGNNPAISEGYNIFGSSPVCSGSLIPPAPTDLVGVDPGLSPLSPEGYHLIFPGSPALNTGNDASCPAVDQRGVTRPQDGHCDIGAFEYRPPIHVRWNAGGADDGSSWTDAYTDLQSALSAASSGDEVWVAAGTYKPTPGADRMVSFLLKNGVVIYGGFAGNESLRTQRDFQTNVTILSGNIGSAGNSSDNSYHVVVGSGTNDSAVLDGFTITAGNANGATAALSRGGGIFNENGSPSLTNIIFSNNTATNGGGGMFNSLSNPVLADVSFSGNSTTALGGEGGGLKNDRSHPVLTNVTFNANLASYGGGMYNALSHPILTDATFSGNQAGQTGGGMYNIGSNPTLLNVSFSDNQATYNGGGMHNASSAPALTQAAFTGNQADKGGGMSNESCDPLLTDVIFSNNTASEGGGLYNRYSSPTVTDADFSGNLASSDGGGMYNYVASPSVNDAAFHDNSAKRGGGMFTDGVDAWNGSSPILTDVAFINNTATEGGGMQNTNYSTPSLTNVIFDHNLAEWGAGMGNYQSNPALTNVIFSNNAAISSTENPPSGGGIFNTASSPILTHVTFSNNSADYGGGIFLQSGSSPTLVNATFSSNAAVYGSGILSRDVDSSPKLIHVTLSNNSASVNGGTFANAGSPVIQNSILWGNTGGEIINVNLGVPVVTNSIVQGGYTGTGNLDANPLLGPLQDNGGFTPTMAVGVGSPAIDAGGDANCPATDQRGVTRPQGSHCDIGAYEHQDAIAPAVSSITRIDPSPTSGTSVQFSVAFSESVTGVDVTAPFGDFLLYTTGVSGAEITNVSGSNATYAVTVTTGSGNGTIRLDVPDTATITDTFGNPPADLPYTGGEVYAVEKMKTFFSTASQDGWILESAETSSIGGAKNNGAATLRVGDDASNKQYRAFLSFDTSTIPDNAVITSVMFKFRYAGKVGTLPFGTHGDLLGDIRNGAFSGNPVLQLADFSAKGTVATYKGKALIFTSSMVDGWYSQSLLPADIPFINLGGVTQFRLRFARDDNNDRGADYLKIYSGNALLGTDHPQLVIEYYLP